MIEAHAAGDDPMAKLDSIDLHSGKMFRAEREMYGDILEDIRVIMDEYFKHWGDELVYSRKLKRWAEFPFEIEIADGLVFKGKIDGVGRSRKMRWLVEHKTFTRQPNEDDQWRSVQSAVYIRAVQINGWWSDIEGTLWDYIRSKPPATPGLLKNGEISRARLDSLPNRVKAFIVASGKDPKKYKELIKTAEDNRSSYFIRAYSPIKPAVIDDTWSDFLETALEIRDNHGKSKTRTISKNCSWCDFEPLCRAEMQGLDTDYIIKREYTTDPEDKLDETNSEEE